MLRSMLTGSLLLCALATPAHSATDTAPLRGKALDARIAWLMKEAKVPGLAVAIVEDGKVTSVRAYGQRDVEKGLPLTTDTVMYAASLTKAAFAITGTRWNGPKFFGLRDQPAKEVGR